jgi:hypothetical protein
MNSEKLIPIITAIIVGLSSTGVYSAADLSGTRSYKDSLEAKVANAERIEEENVALRAKIAVQGDLIMKMARCKR